ncbi:MAG: FG-GAP repeat protein [Methylococcaceae bacterium]
MNKINTKRYRFILILSFLFCLSPAILAQTQLLELAKQIQPGEIPQGLTTHDWGNIQQQINAAKYRVHADDNGGYRASNPSQGWQIQYTADGTTTLTPRNNQTKPYHLGMKLTAIGYQNLQTLHKPQKISQKDFTVSYQWNDNLRERWINSEQQLEQWFDIAHRPKGASKGMPLTVQITLDSKLRITQNGNNIQFSNAKGIDITYNKLKVWDSTGKELPAQMKLANKTLNLLVDDSTARYPLTIDPSFQQQAYLTASNTDDKDQFGTSVAISGDTLVVGAPGESSNSTGVNGDQSDNSAERAGAAYVFIHNGSSWVQQAYLKASNTDARDRFGESVAISGDTLVVGAPDENSIGVSGAAYVFTRNGRTWTQQAYLKASNNGHLFGDSVAISGDTLVVTSWAESSNSTGVNGDQNDSSLFHAGAAYVFTRSGTTWTQQAYLKASNPDEEDEFGESVAISGDTLVVGTFQERSSSTGVNSDQSDNSALGAGAAYVFIRNGSTWTQQAYLKASNTDAGDYFGFSLSISGDTLVVGAPGEESNSTGVNGDQSDNSSRNSGAAYVFTRSDTTWTQQAYLKPSKTAYRSFGASVAISADTLIVSPSSVFTRSATTWTQQAALKKSSGSVAISGNTLVTSNGGGTAYIVGISDVQPMVESLSIPIQTKSDDAEENLSDGDVSLFSSDLELIQDGLKLQLVGLRFPLNIPAGATILNATIQFTTDETSSIQTDLVVSAEATPHALTFADLDSDISNRPLMATSIPWTPLAWSLKGKAGSNQQTPDLSTIVQEIVDQGNWVQGNSIAFIISGNGMREAESFDGTSPPVLHVTFSNEPIVDEVTYAIGDTGPGGGIVFYTSNEGLNGLEVAPGNQGQAVWGCFARTNPPAIITGANGTKVGSGAQNTADILAACSEPGIAAEIADLYQFNEVSDWFLPSANEALLMYEQRVLLGLNANFWTSTENSAYSSFYIRLAQGDTRTGNKEKFFDVWPIRDF